jgi:signal transduction histidine kinase/ActR/RegA family two-component response regulator
MKQSRKYRTLLVDDVGALRRLIKIAVERQGDFQVVAEAATGREGVEEAQRTQPDLVLLDLSMPEMDGLEALPLILRAAPKARVVVLSGFNHVRMGPVALRMGASGYLEKGLEPAKMAEAILEIMEPGPAGMEEQGPAGTEQPDPVLMHERAGRTTTGGVSYPRRLMEPPSDHRVLLVMDDAVKLKRFRGLLQHKGVPSFVPVVGSSLEDALTHLEAHEVDLVLVDPDVLGVPPDEDLIGLLTAAPETPVVVIVSEEDPGLAERSFRLGVEDCILLEKADPDLLRRSMLYAIERRRAYEIRRQLREQESEVERLHRIDAMKAHFFNTAAHELGTPLTPIRLQLHLLKGSDPQGLSPIQKKALEVLERNVDRLSRLTQDLLDVAKIQTGFMRLEKRPLEVARVVEEVRDSFEPVAVSRGIDFQVSCLDAGIIEADPKRIGQVLYNLVDNALKFTPPGGLVRLECRREDAEYVARVQDTGVGLSEDQISRLFQPFTQVLGDDQPSGIGSGLGLYVSKGIVELHEGRMWCESDGPGEGCLFCVALPSVSVSWDAKGSKGRSSVKGLLREGFFLPAGSGGVGDG